MRKVVLFIATSLDGFIAGKDGNIDWLYTDGDFGYTEFLKSIDTTLMGHNTYKDILQFGTFPYPDKKNYVFTRQKREADSNPVTFITGGVANFVSCLKSEKGKNIWLIGGGQINSILLNNNLIDQMIISIHPKVLGEGIPLFKTESLSNLQFQLERHKVYERGLVQLTYSTIY
jgi:dihydrofolate reductase